MIGMALWFTDPLAREVEPTKIPGVTEQLMLATFGGLWCGSSLATLGIKDIPNGGQQLYYGSSSSRGAVLDTTGELTTMTKIDPTIYSFVCVESCMEGHYRSAGEATRQALKVMTLTCE